MTYIYCIFSAIPYLYVGGCWNSGKSRLLKLLHQLVFRPFQSINPTAASVFRTLDDQGGTLLFDEAEQLRHTKNSAPSTLLSTLLGGYSEDSQVTRMDPGGKGARQFDVFSPKALACIAAFSRTLSSRCIEIPMLPAPPRSSMASRRIDRRSPVWQRLRDDLHAFAMEHGPAWLKLPEQSEVCESIHNRNYEVWQPILALAAWLEQQGVLGLFNLVRDFALTTSGEDPVPEDDEILLRLLAEARLRGEQPEPGEILDKAKERAGYLFQGIRPSEVTRRLKRYGIPKTDRSNGRRVFREVTLDMLRRVQTNFGVDLGIPDRHSAETEPVTPRRRLRRPRRKRTERYPARQAPSQGARPRRRWQCRWRPRPSSYTNTAVAECC